MSQVIIRKVLIGLSGGVDSSVSAALLKKQGSAVIGVFIRVWSGDTELTRNGERGTDAEQGSTLNREKGRTLFGMCQAADDRLDAMRVCAKLDIPFVELNLEKEYKREVVDYMIREYKAGKTPNPDVFCNRFIKFGGFYKWARAQGADFIATGHYARVLSSPRKRGSRLDSRLRGNDTLLTANYSLLAGLDSEKDQSYFLWQIRTEQLPHILFPVGGMKKPEVRKLARKFGLITADKKDSQGLCFVGKVDMKEFLAHYITPKKGTVLNERGEVIGEHDGAAFYTIGERFGLSPRLNLKSGERFSLGESRPLYISGKDMEQNTLTVSPKSPDSSLPNGVREVIIRDCNWLSKPVKGKTYSARVRYRQPLQSCKFEVKSCKVIFDKAQTAVSGQSLVLYDGEVLVGGGIIQ